MRIEWIVEGRGGYDHNSLISKIAHYKKEQGTGNEFIRINVITKLS